MAGRVSKWLLMHERVAPVLAAKTRHSAAYLAQARPMMDAVAISSSSKASDTLPDTE